MLNRLQKKWKVSGWQLVLVLGTFALGGSLCGYITRELLRQFTIENDFIFGTLYFLCLTILWPFSVLLISIPLGQYRFFSNYLQRIRNRLGMSIKQDKGQTSVTIAIFASGSGSNARKIMERFQKHPLIKVGLLVSNKPGAGALHHAADFGISTLIIEKEQFFRGDAYLPELEAAGIDYVILAGFLWKIPSALVAAYPHRMINIHPALLPKYGGKGMYGKFVHKAVIAAGDNESGITIHFVDEHYDHGATIFQAKCPVYATDTPDSLAERIHELEHTHFAAVIEKVITEAVGQ
jgi:formyltetrahydrofolate-dependent phosphoribosylglycinamide formyltransferase